MEILAGTITMASNGISEACFLREVQASGLRNLPNKLRPDRRSENGIAMAFGINISNY
jgi:hypothetical protein